MIGVFLLGTNPLPVYVAIQVLKDKFSKIIIVCTEDVDGLQSGSEVYYDMLKRKCDDVDFEQLLINDITNIDAYYETLTDRFGNVHEQIHLHYTAGTKSMSVHSFDFFNSFFKENFQYSYLDARKYEIFIHEFESPTLEIKNIREKVNLTIKDLIELHRFNLLKEETKHTEELLDTDYQALYPIIKQHVINGNYLTIKKKYNDLLNKIYKYGGNYMCNPRDNDKFTNFNKINNVTEKLQLVDLINIDPEVSIIFNSIQGDSRLYINGSMIIPQNEAEFNKLEVPFREVLLFLESKFLEVYVYECLNNLAQYHTSPKNFGHSIEAQHVNIVKSDNKFEFDNYYIRGYQLFAITVSTSDKKTECKLKLFEMYYRAKQIGGEEARFIGVFGLNGNAINELKADLITDTGASKSHFEIFGKDDLPRLQNKLVSFIYNS